MKYLRFKDKNTAEIRQLFTKTFGDSEGQDEGLLTGALAEDLLTKTDDNDLQVFIAVDKDKIIGCILFSRLRFEKSHLKAFLLAPVAVHTDYQGKGIGQKLIHFGHSELKKDGVELVVTYGDIHFYSRVGYKQITEDVIPAPMKLTYPEGWLAQSLSGKEIAPAEGSTFCVDEINKPEYW